MSIIWLRSYKSLSSLSEQFLEMRCAKLVEYELRT